ncbi:M1 family aminopeptidase [Hymenobacter properus]|uniref:Peptidase M1 membrane alanine aminopeptidase domain-containing protein n=1 Tax=Hymenobacter properus TaxID=2791026 RepID=A0A931FK56_9BACT|nr:M1 family aminopeptidase [Hymenobacter properus]MBF9140671.1 hypothetical protein [Hymenobacter properus]MBR7719479.1 hypothetical protein [Microvirga sp. SRT04]
MPRLLLSFLLGMLGLAPPAWAQQQARILLKVAPDSQHFWCRYTVWLPAGSARSPRFLNLDRRFTVIRVRSPRLSGLSIQPYLYAPFQDTVQRIALAHPGLKQRRKRVTITYEGTLSDRYATDQVMEFSRSTLWLPFVPYQEDAPLAYSLDVQVPASYTVVSTRPSRKARAGHFRFRGRTSAIEPTALVGRNFHQLTAAPPKPAVTVIKANPLLRADTLLLAEATRICSYYNQTIGRRDSIARFTVLLPGTNRNAFALLDNAVDITYSDFDVRKREDRLILAHEISHKWWAYGSISTYEEWLNEGFATYSGLLYLRAAGDTAGFRTELDKRLASAAGAPPILGFDRSKYDYPTIRRVVYAKGTAVLHALHTRVGDDVFLRLLAATAARKTATTEGFLTLVGQEAGPDTQRWLREQLAR